MKIRMQNGLPYVQASLIHQRTFELHNFEIEIGTMDYGFAIDGIIGINFLRQVGACIDLSKLEIYSS